jgi:hypothetical protein
LGVSFAGTKIAHKSSYQALMERKAEIADHFRRRSIAQGQDGNFGALFTHHLRLRNIYAGLCSLIDNPNLSFLLEGATGTGKDRMIQEFVRLENVYRKLLGLEQGIQGSLPVGHHAESRQLREFPRDHQGETECTQDKHRSRHCISGNRCSCTQKGHSQKEPW